MPTVPPVGPIRPNARCPGCGARDRIRHVWLYLVNKTNLLTDRLRVLHVAPERILERKLKRRANLQYVSLDLARPRARVRGDITALPFADESFDVVTCNWVLYHLVDVDRGLAELARVLRPGGRFIGIYNRRDNLRALWSALGDPWPADDFDCENGVGTLRRHFAHVERRDTGGEVLWEDREALQTYLDAFLELVGELRAPAGPYPFRDTRANCVLVAEKA